MEEHALALLDSNGIAVPQHPAIDGEIPVAHFVAAGHALRERSSHRGLPRRFQFLNLRGRSQKILSHVAALPASGLKLFQHKKYLAVVIARLVLWLNINWPHLTAILASVQIRPGSFVRVIKTETRGTGSELNSTHTVRGDEWLPFLHRAIHIRRNELTVPVQLLRRVRVIVPFHDRWLPLFETPPRPWELAVICDRRDDVFGCDFDRSCANGQNIVRRVRIRWRGDGLCCQVERGRWERCSARCRSR